MRCSLFALGFVAATASVTLAADGMMKTRKLPDDAVVAPPVGVEVKPLPDDLIRAPEHMQPGTHTLTLDVAQSLPKETRKSFSGTGYRCYFGDTPIAEPGPGNAVGWWEHEPYGGSPCGAGVTHLALLFDKGDLAHIPEKRIDRVVLTYDEEAYPGCWMIDHPENKNCWTNGEGLPEQKPDGCVVVRVPTIAWHEANPPGPIPYATSSPTVRRLGTREWDVTEPYIWQNVTGAAPLGASPTYGFLLTGSITSVAELEGEDTTHCVSHVSNLKLNVTYTVPEPSGPPPVVR